MAVRGQADLGLPIADVIRQVGTSEQAHYRWMKQYHRVQSDKVRELNQQQGPRDSASLASEPNSGVIRPRKNPTMERDDVIQLVDKWMVASDTAEN